MCDEQRKKLHYFINLLKNLPEDHPQRAARISHFKQTISKIIKSIEKQNSDRQRLIRYEIEMAEKILRL